MTERLGRFYVPELRVEGLGHDLSLGFRVSGCCVQTKFGFDLIKDREQGQ